MQESVPSLSSNTTQSKILRYAAIDIGSNAVRLLLCNAVEEHGETHFKKAELIRIPLRLGEDVFQSGRVTASRATRFIKTMHAFKLLVDVFEPVAYRACATASLREAENGQELVKMVKKECGLKIEIITGKTEADLIFSNHVEENLDKSRSYLYIDVGGGSTEVTLFHKGQCAFSQSFEIGTLRWLKGQVPTDRWFAFKDKIRGLVNGYRPLVGIGSGGNINKIFKMLDKKDKPLQFEELKSLYDELKVHSVEDRMELWQLNPDRADVIVPAAKIFLGIMKSAQIQELIVPQIGLSDGIIHQLHEEYKRGMVA